jgi:hypothetical protein
VAAVELGIQVVLAVPEVQVVVAQVLLVMVFQEQTVSAAVVAAQKDKVPAAAVTAEME